eukprot:6469787-Amphidinium_carterae.1
MLALSRDSFEAVFPCSAHLWREKRSHECATAICGGVQLGALHEPQELRQPILEQLSQTVGDVLRGCLWLFGEFCEVTT